MKAAWLLHFIAIIVLHIVTLLLLIVLGIHNVVQSVLLVNLLQLLSSVEGGKVPSKKSAGAAAQLARRRIQQKEIMQGILAYIDQFTLTRTICHFKELNTTSSKPQKLEAELHSGSDDECDDFQPAGIHAA